MVDRFYGYQYDTSPRKLSPDYTPYRNRYSKKEEDIPVSNKSASIRKNNQVHLDKKVEKTNHIEKKKTNVKNVKSKAKIVMLLVVSFSVLFAIGYQNSLITESFNRKEEYKEQMEALSKTNQQIEVSIENSLNLNNIEQVAKETLGMQKLTNEQKVYVSLPKEDYVAPAAEQIIMEENLGFFEKIVKGFTGILD